MTRLCLTAVCALILVHAGCGPAKETATPPPVVVAMTAETFTREGRRLHAEGKIDSASSAFAEALRIDSTYRPALEQKALMFYTQVMKEQGDTQRRRSASRTARETYMRLEQLGIREADVYERICELSLLLGDDAVFLRYAKKNAEQFPFDRQQYNLGLAYVRTGGYAEAIKLLKEATEKFPASVYIAGFYRQLGKAYAGVDRDQTAERTYVAGVKAANERLSALGNAGSVSTPDRQRLMDDKIAMLLALKKLHQTYKHEDRLKEVERQLKEAGYGK
jgi:tetratricopeptide (TPR) repeat protein